MVLLWCGLRGNAQKNHSAPYILTSKNALAANGAMENFPHNCTLL